jgi:hypothetical protein
MILYKMTVLALYIHCFLYYFPCVLSEANVVLRYYTTESSLDNKVSNTSLKMEHYSESLIECSVKCGELCACVGFNRQERKCRIHQSCDQPDMAADESGWRYYCLNGMSLYNHLLQIPLTTTH